MDKTEIIGYLAMLMTTPAILPQVVQIIRTRDTKAISLGMYILISCGLGLWMTYGILLEQWPLIIANFVGFSLACVVLVLKLIYK
ncbi:MAG: SemiSWEET transporter [Magnetococcales bacterium]|nr:SemiSWEET transporter [Magnetococcales bacterium]